MPINKRRMGRQIVLIAIIAMLSVGVGAARPARNQDPATDPIQVRKSDPVHGWNPIVRLRRLLIQVLEDLGPPHP